MIEKLDLRIEQLELALNTMQGKIRKLQNKYEEVESLASCALDEFEKIASVRVQVVRADASKDLYQGYISTESLDAKLRFISDAGGSFSHLRVPMNNLRSKLKAI